MKKKSVEKGITLIALVVTIVVLLILAGVSISMLTGENGVMNQAKEAKIKTRANGAEEVVKLWKSNNYVAGTSDQEKVDKETMLQDLKDKKLVYENEIDRINEIITIKKKDGTIVKEISYGDIIINISKNPETKKSPMVFLTVESVEGTVMPSLKSEEEINNFVNSISEELKIEYIKNDSIRSANKYYPTINCKTFRDVLELLKNQGEIEEATEEKFWNYIEVRDAEEMNSYILGMLKYYYNNSYPNEVKGYIATNPEGELSDTYIATENGTYTFIIQDAVTGKKYTKTVEVTNIDKSLPVNIFTYNPETGYITGIQEKYLEYVDTASISLPIKVASLQKKYYIGSVQIIQRKLIKEVGTSLTIPREIDGVQIKGIDDRAFENIINLEKMIILDNITSIGDDAFWGCIGLINITISDGVTSIGYQAFEKCSSLTTVNYTGTEEQWNAITIGDYNTILNSVKINYNYNK